jgi:hypothetical protein
MHRFLHLRLRGILKTYSTRFCHHPQHGILTGGQQKEVITFVSNPAVPKSMEIRIREDEMGCLRRNPLIVWLLPNAKDLVPQTMKLNRSLKMCTLAAVYDYHLKHEYTSQCYQGKT